MKYDTRVLCFFPIGFIGVEFDVFRRTAGVFIVHSFGGYFDLSPWTSSYLFLFIRRLGGNKSLHMVIQGLYLFPGNAQKSQRIYFLFRRAPIN